MSPRRTAAVASVLLALLGASCVGGDDGATTTDSVSTTNGATTTDVSNDVEPLLHVSAESDDGAIAVEVTASEAAIWMATDAEAVCSPAEPAVSIFEAVTTGDVGAVRGRFVDDNGRAKVADFALDDDDVWRLVIGPIDAKRSSKDSNLDVTVVALPTSAVDAQFVAVAEDASTTSDPRATSTTSTTSTTTTLAGRGDDFVVPDGAATATIELDILAPEPCGNGRPNRRPSPEPVTLEARVDQSVVVGSGVDDCAGRPVSTKLTASTGGNVVAVEASVTLPTGQTVSKSLGGGPRRWQATLGPFPSSASMPASTSIDIDVRAIDARGGAHTEKVRVTLARPEPCAGTPTTVVGAEVLGLTTSPSPLEIWGTATGRCPAGPTQATISVSAPSAVTGVTMEVRVGGASTTSTLTNSAGTWSGTIGPFPATPSSPAVADINVRIAVSDGTRSESLTTAGTIRRPDACGVGTPSTTAAPAPATTVAPAPATTAAPVTTVTTTPPPTPVDVRAQASSPVWAVADGFCGGGSTTLSIQAQTTGDVTQVGAQVTLANGTSKNVQLTGGGSNWSASVGPFPASAQMPDSSAISISVIARDAAGQQASASASSTLRKPSPC